MTPRLKRIYELGKELSWSDTFIFVKEKKYVTKEDIYSVSHFLGNTNLKTTQHYMDKLNSQRIFRRSNNKFS